MHSHVRRQMRFPAISCGACRTTERPLIGVAPQVLFQSDWFGVALLTSRPMAEIFPFLTGFLVGRSVSLLRLGGDEFAIDDNELRGLRGGAARF